MIEYSSFSHKGGSLVNEDLMNINYYNDFTSFIYYGSSPVSNESSNRAASLCLTFVADNRG